MKEGDLYSKDIKMSKENRIEPKYCEFTTEQYSLLRMKKGKPRTTNAIPGEATII